LPFVFRGKTLFLRLFYNKEGKSVFSQ